MLLICGIIILASCFSILSDGREVPDYFDGTAIHNFSPYFTYGRYYTSSGGTDDETLAEPVRFSEGVASGINITLVKNPEISGKIYLPDGEKAPAEGLYVYVGAKCLNGDYYGQLYKIEPGANSADYVLYF
jgi:hypothetical protein